MKLPIAFFLQGIDEKKVYYFSSVKLNTSVPHYFIAVLKGSNNTVYWFVVPHKEKTNVKNVSKN